MKKIIFDGKSRMELSNSIREMIFNGNPETVFELLKTHLFDEFLTIEDKLILNYRYINTLKRRDFYEKN